MNWTCTAPPQEVGLWHTTEDHGDAAVPSGPIAGTSVISCQTSYSDTSGGRQLGGVRRLDPDWSPVPSDVRTFGSAATRAQNLLRCIGLKEVCAGIAR